MKELDGAVLPLLVWYRENARDLPWRRDPTPYHVLVSEIMLQQTRVAAVLDHYRRFLEELPTAEDLAACPEERLMKLWQGLGYYSRARNLRRAARQVVDSGGFPSDYAAIRSLAGVGDYTAGAVASIAFGQPRAAVDGNVLRVVSRLTGDRRDISLLSTRKEVTAELERVIPAHCPGDFNQALMELGAVVCLPNGAPLCDRCPLREGCAACEEGLAGELPVKAPRAGRRVEERNVWLIFHAGRVALRRRGDKGLLAGLWEFPNGLVPCRCPVEGETAFAAAGKHVFTHIEWHMNGYTVRPESDVLPDGWVWAGRAELTERYPIPSAFRAFAPAVEENLGR